MLNSDEQGPDGLTREARAAGWTRLERELSFVRRSEVLLYLDRGQRVPEHCGCGLLVAIGQEAGILTAAHVARSVLSEPQRAQVLYRGDFIPLRARVRATTGGEGDRIDAAALLLDAGQDRDRMRVFSFAIVPGSTVPSPVRSGSLVLRGHPHRKASNVRAGAITPTPYQWWGPVVSPPAGEPAEVIAMGLEFGDVTDDTGVRRAGASPKGASGSALWHDAGDGPLRLAGIFTGARQNGPILGTTAVVHLVLLRRLIEETPAPVGTA